MNNIEEKEIDLRELFKIIWNRKLFIVIFTSIITLLAILYVYNKTPIYEASALIEIGSYKTNGSTSRLDNPVNLSQKLNVLYIDLLKNKQDRISKISKISVPKNSKEFIQIVSEATSNELAIKEIKNVVEYIKIDHKKTLDDINTKRELSLKNIISKIKNLKEIEIPTYEDTIKYQESTLNKYKNELLSINDIIKEIEKKDSSLTALKLMEKSQILNSVAQLEVQLFEIKIKSNDIKTNTLSTLEENKKQSLSLLLKHNYKNSEIVGEVITADYPVKPKKKLIVVVSFVTAFILSIFLVFFMALISGIKEEKQ